MARKASSKPESSNPTATIGFEAQNGGQSRGARSTAKANSQDESSGVHQFGVQPKGNANFRWVQHLIHHLATHGMAGFVLANGSMSSNRSGEGDIRRA
jgi:type I restriction-modification system DNA methylase subunit